MATITIAPMTCNHIHLTVTQGAKSIKIITTKQELKSLAATDEDEIRTVILRNLITFVRDSGLTNWQDIKTAIEAQEFKL